MSRGIEFRVLVLIDTYRITDPYLLDSYYVEYLMIHITPSRLYHYNNIGEKCKAVWYIFFLQLCVCFLCRNNT